jgi:hypothetical protein
MADKTYNGWTNYETWAVKLWIDNEQGTYEYWREAAVDAWEMAGDETPNQFMDHSSNAQSMLATRLKDEHDSQSDHPVFAAAEGSVYADLLNAALSDVNWHEIAESLLESEQENETINGYQPSTARK